MVMQNKEVKSKLIGVVGLPAAEQMEQRLQSLPPETEPLLMVMHMLVKQSLRKALVLLLLAMPLTTTFWR
jgi:hypothetical protein